jgi:hypothetical protein
METHMNRYQALELLLSQKLLKKYWSKGRTYRIRSWFDGQLHDEPYRSIMHGVPMQYLGILRSFCLDEGLRIKVRYRGPRAGRPNSTKNQRQSYCLKKDATSFAVYLQY